MQKLIEKLIIDKGTTNGLTDLPNDSTVNDLMDYLKDNNPDDHISYDENIESLIEDLHYSEFTNSEIITFNTSQQYYSYISFYHYTNLDIYVMHFMVLRDEMEFITKNNDFKGEN